MPRPVSVLPPPRRSLVDMEAPLPNGLVTAPQRVPLQFVLLHLLDKSYGDLTKLAESLGSKTDSQRKFLLLDYIQRTRLRFVRLLVLVRWSADLESVQRSWDLLTLLNQHEESFRLAADNLWAVHARLQVARNPIYDVPTAVDVLTTGSFCRLPKSVEVLPRESLSSTEQTQAKSRLENAIRVRLLSTSIPPEVNRVVVGDGRLRCRVGNEFEVSLTLDGDSADATWRVLGVKVLVSAASPNDFEMQAYQLHRLKTLIQVRLTTSKDPLVEAFAIAHSFCLALVMETLSIQAQKLESQRWKGLLSVVSTRGKELVLRYWWGTTTTGVAPSTGPLVQITANSALTITSTPTLRDPATGNTVVLDVDVTRLNVEELLLHAIGLHVYNRVLALHEMVLEFKYPENLTVEISCMGTNYDKTVLRIDVFGTPVLRIGVDRRKGNYVPVDMKFKDAPSPDSIEEMLRSQSPNMARVLQVTRNQVAIEHIARVAQILGFEPFQRIPFAMQDTKLFASPVVYLRFQDIYDTYLAVECAIVNMPRFHLVTTRQQSDDDRLVIENIIFLDSFSSYHVRMGDLRTRDFLVVPPKFQGSSTTKFDASPPSSLVELLSRVVLACRQMAGFLRLVAQMEAENLSVVSLVDQVSFRRICGPLDLEFVATVHPGGESWHVTTPDLQAPYVESRPLDPEGQIQWDSSGLTLRYSTLHDASVRQMLADLKGVGMMAQLAVEVVEASKADCVLRGYGGLFQHTRLGFDRIILAYGNTSPRQSMSIAWNTKGETFQLVFHPHDHPMREYAQALLNRCHRLDPLLQAIVHTYTAVQTIQTFLSTPVPGSHIPPVDLCVIPRSISHLRFVFRQTFAVDLRFLENERVSLEEATLPLFTPVSKDHLNVPFFGNTTPPQHGCLLTLPIYSTFLSDHLQPISTDDEMLGTPLTPVSVGLHRTKGAGFCFPVSLLERVLALVYNYMGISDLARCLIPVLVRLRQAQSTESVISNISFDRHGADFATRHLSCHVSIVNAGRMEVNLAERHETVGDSWASGARLTSSDLAVLSSLFSSRVSTHPFSLAALESFLHIVTLPRVALHDVIRLCALEHQGEPIPFSLCLSTPHALHSVVGEPSIRHDACTGELRLVTRFHYPGGPVDLPFRLDYKNRRVFILKEGESDTCVELPTSREDREGVAHTLPLLENITHLRAQQREDVIRYRL